jgi:hypothetical protein
MPDLTTYVAERKDICRREALTVRATRRIGDPSPKSQHGQKAVYAREETPTPHKIQAQREEPARKAAPEECRSIWEKRKDRWEELEPSINRILLVADKAFVSERERLRWVIMRYLTNWYGCSRSTKLDDFVDFRSSGCDKGYCTITIEEKGKYESGIYECPAKKSQEQADTESQAGDETSTVGELDGKCFGQCLEFFRRLEYDETVYSYAVTPKESVQRIASTTRNLRATTMLMALGGQSRGANIEQAMEFANKAHQLTESIRRQPLIVGFADSRIERATDIDRATPKAPITRFGWLIGPKFEGIQRKFEAEFAHIPIQNALSAVISVPSWWKSVALETRACWLSSRDSSLWSNGTFEKLCTERSTKEPPPYTVKLPGHVEEIPRRLGYTVGRRPRIAGFGRDVGSYFVGQKDAQMIINGLDLWRSTVVTMGGQRADWIEVMPNMKGIIARFGEITEPPRWKQACWTDVEIYVWTSEGRTDLATAQIFRTPEAFRRSSLLPQWQAAKRNPPRRQGAMANEVANDSPECYEEWICRGYPLGSNRCVGQASSRQTIRE